MKEDWLAFANCKWHKDKDEWEMIKRPVIYINEAL